MPLRKSFATNPGCGSREKDQDMLCLSVAVLVAMAWPAAGAGGLTDHPIVASSVHYLDGDGWSASAIIAPPRAPDCDFLNDTDFNHGKSTGAHAQVSSRDECCALCARSPECAAAVLAGDDSCWLKTSQDMQVKSVVKGVAACVLKSAPASKGHKVSIPAQVSF